MMDNFTFIILVHLFLLTASETYFIDCEGDDNNDGNSSDSPWKTLSKLSSEQHNLNPGDVIYFKNGCSWNEGINFFNHAGTEDQPFTITNYGNKNKDLPTFTGKLLLTEYTWTRYQDDLTKNIFSIDIDINVHKNEFGELFVDEELYHVACYPQDAPFDWFYINKTTTNNVIHVNDDFLSLKSEQVVGAYAIVRAIYWTVYKSEVIAYDINGRTITLNSVSTDSNYNYKENFGFFLVNKIWMMKEKNWVYDNSLKRLYVYFPSGTTPSSFNSIFASSSPSTYGHFMIQDCHHVILENIKIAYTAAGNAITVGGDTSYVTVRNCIVEWSNTGVDIGGWSNAHHIYIHDNTITHVLSNGIQTWVGESTNFNGANYTYIFKNIIEGVGEFGHYTRRLFELDKHPPSGYGMEINSRYSYVYDNTISYTSKGGIFVYGWDCRIESNYVHHVGYVLDDCGLIYFWTGGRSYSIGNLGKAGIGNPTGTPSFFDDDDDVDEYVNIDGLYTDTVTINVTLEHNTMIDVDVGAQLHAGKDHTLKNNLIFNSKTGWNIIESSMLEEFGEGSGYCVNHVVDDNIFHIYETKSDFGTCGYLFDEYGVDTTHFVTSVDKNLYFTPKNYNNFRIYAYPAEYYIYNNLEMWKAATGYDTNSEFLGKGFYPRKPPVTYNVIGNNLINNGDFDTNIDDWSCWEETRYNLEWENGRLKSTYSQMPKDIYYLMAFQISKFTLEKGKIYEIKYSIECDQNEYLKCSLKSSTQTYYSEGHTYPKDTVNNVIDIYTHEDENDEVIIRFGSGINANLCYFDSIGVREISNLKKYDDYSNDYCVIYNPTLITKTYTLPGEFCDVEGNKISKVTLDKRRGMMLINCQGQPACPVNEDEKGPVTIDLFWLIVIIIGCSVGVVVVIGLIIMIVVSIVFGVIFVNLKIRSDKNSEMEMNKF